LQRTNSKPFKIESKPNSGQEAATSPASTDQKCDGPKLLSKSEGSGDDIQKVGEDESATDSLLDKLNSSIGNPADLSSKKLQYLEQDIMDKRGVFKYTDDPSTYKKARKRLQNRESAVRSRSRKATELEDLRKEVQALKQERETQIARINQLE